MNSFFIYIDLVGDRYRLESALNREMDQLPEAEKAAILSTYVTGTGSDALWDCLLTLTEQIYDELEGVEPPITREMLHTYYQNLR